MRRRHQHPTRAIVLLLAAAALAEPRAAHADRSWSGGVGVGGFAARGGPASTGLSATASLSPGGRAGALGIRLEARSAGPDGERLDRGLYLAGLTYEAAAARPRLALSLHGEAGSLAPEPRAAVGGGGEVQLWLVGPLAIALGASAHLLVDGIDSQLVLAGTVGVRVAR